MRSTFPRNLGSTVALLLAMAPTASLANTDVGTNLEVVEELRGPFQHAVVGSSLVQSDGTVLASAGATLTLPADSSLVEARLFWMGSRSRPDDAVVLARTDGVTQTVSSNNCLTVENVNRADVDYYQCSAVVTPFVAGAALSGRYTVSGAKFDTIGATFGNDATADFSNNLYAGSFALVVIYETQSDRLPRVIQLLSGLRAQHADDNGVVRSNVAAFDPLELSENGGRLSLIAMEGDPELGGGERVDLCRGVCGGGAVPANTIKADLIQSTGNTIGNLFNETITSELANVISAVTEKNGLDLDTFDLAPAFVANDRAADQFIAADQRLHVAITTGQDTVVHVAMVIEISDFDGDGDGLSNIEEEELGTNPDVVDTDGDGIGDGLEVRGGDPADPANPANNVTDPLDPDSDDDGLCDGSKTVAGVCVGGEDDDDGLRAATETDPNNPDTDGDGLKDGVEVAGSNYPGPLGPHTDPLDPDTDKDGIKDGNEDRNGDGTFDAAAGETDPTSPDSDGDGVCDGAVAAAGCVGRDDLAEDPDQDGLSTGDELTIGTDPNNADTDHDGIDDGVEVNGDNKTNPTSADSDVDGLCDGPLSVDGVCIGELNGVVVGEDKDANGARDDGETDPVVADSDGDGVNDGTEVTAQYPAGPASDPLNPDTDGDGVRDGDEDLDHDGTLDDGETDPTGPDAAQVEEPLELFITGSALWSGCDAMGGGANGAPLLLGAFGLMLAGGVRRRRRQS